MHAGLHHKLPVSAGGSGESVQHSSVPAGSSHEAFQPLSSSARGSGKPSAQPQPVKAKLAARSVQPQHALFQPEVVASSGLALSGLARRPSAKPPNGLWSYTVAERHYPLNLGVVIEMDMIMFKVLGIISRLRSNWILREEVGGRLSTSRHSTTKL